MRAPPTSTPAAGVIPECGPMHYLFARRRPQRRVARCARAPQYAAEQRAAAARRCTNGFDFENTLYGVKCVPICNTNRSAGLHIAFQGSVTVDDGIHSACSLASLDRYTPFISNFASLSVLAGYIGGDAVRHGVAAVEPMTPPKRARTRKPFGGSQLCPTGAILSNCVGTNAGPEA